MKVALVTFAGMPELYFDDRLLRDALVSLGAEVRAPSWDDASVDWARFDCAVVRSTWDYTTRHGEFLDWIDRAGSQTVLLNSPQSMRWNSDKKYLLELEARGHAIPQTIVFDPGAMALKHVMQAADWERCIIKPVVGATARRTLLVDETNLNECAANLAEWSAEEEFFVQEFMDSVFEGGEISLMFIDGHYSHSVRKNGKPGDFRVQSDHGGTVSRHMPDAAMVAAAEAILCDAPAALLYARVDMVESSTGPRLMELEIIEPELFFRIRPESAGEMAQAILRRVS